MSQILTFENPLGSPYSPMIPMTWRGLRDSCCGLPGTADGEAQEDQQIRPEEPGEPDQLKSMLVRMHG
jgi:hypothetical protein